MIVTMVYKGNSDKKKDLHDRLNKIADDQSTYVKLTMKELQTLLKCSQHDLSMALLDTLTPPPVEVRENTLLDLHYEGKSSTEIAETMGLDLIQIRRLAHRMGLKLKQSRETPKEWTAEEDQILIDNFMGETYMPLPDLYAAVGRTRGQVEYRLSQLRAKGVIPHTLHHRSTGNKRVAN